MATLEWVLYGAVTMIVGPPLIEDVRDMAAERDTPLRRFVVRICEIVLWPCSWLLIVAIGGPVLIGMVLLVLGLAGIVLYGIYTGIVSLPTSAAIVIGAIIIAVAIRGRRH